MKSLFHIPRRKKAHKKIPTLEEKSWKKKLSDITNVQKKKKIPLSHCAPNTSINTY